MGKFYDNSFRRKKCDLILGHNVDSMLASQSGGCGFDTQLVHAVTLLT